jgi:NAD(P)H dehydrogenase (quinone)
LGGNIGRKVLITGATGDTGRPAVKGSLKVGLDVRVMVHAIDDRSKRLANLGAEIVVGDLQEIDTIKQAMDGMGAAYFVNQIKPV